MVITLLISIQYSIHLPKTITIQNVLCEMLAQMVEEKLLNQMETILSENTYFWHLGIHS